MDVSDCFDQTPLAMSILTVPDKRIVQILVEAGADTNFKSRTKLPLLTEAILTVNIFHHFNVIQTLIEYGANINERDEIKLETPLHKAAMVGHVPLIEYLLELGAEIDAVNVYGQTPYMIAKAQNNMRAAEALSHVENLRIEKELRQLEEAHGRTI